MGVPLSPLEGALTVGYPPFSSIQIEHLLAALVILFHTKRELKLRAGCATHLYDGSKLLIFYITPDRMRCATRRSDGLKLRAELLY